MRRPWTRRVWIVERTLSIGLGIKRTSKRQVGRPELLTLMPALEGSQAIPVGPLPLDDFFRRDHGFQSTRRAGVYNSSHLLGCRYGIASFTCLPEWHFGAKKEMRNREQRMEMRNGGRDGSSRPNRWTARDVSLAFSCLSFPVSIPCSLFLILSGFQDLTLVIRALAIPYLHPAPEGGQTHVLP